MNRLLIIALTATLVLGFAPAASAATMCGGYNATHVGNNAANTIHGRRSTGAEVRAPPPKSRRNR